MTRTTSRRAVLGALAGAAAPRVRAQAVLVPPELRQALPGARLHGQGRLRFFGLHVYDIRLWTAGEQRAQALAETWAEQPLALEILYARSLYGRKIAERSIEEMRRQADLAPAQAGRWLAEMTRLFPDVQEGDRLSAVQRPGEAASLHFNGALRGELRDALFTRLFFGIWLAPESSEPGLRQRLLGPGA